MSGGLLLVVAAGWLLSQVLAGNALGRLGISGEPTKPGTKQGRAEGAMHEPGTWVPGVGWQD